MAKRIYHDFFGPSCHLCEKTKPGKLEPAEYGIKRQHGKKIAKY